ncbi:MAG: zinc-ribbon domain-containing protein, partial [Methanocorpusculum sp.]|nr:zinc-ribbon domain-containing protein [Methanocorpusculum sp.]
TSGSSKKVWWKCSICGYEWKSIVCDRNSDTGCPACSGKVTVSGINDLATTNPNLVKEWHPTKNGSITPYNVTKCSNKKVWWTCDKGHEWEAKISRRTSGDNCPYCSSRKVLKGYNDLATLNPELAKEWHPTKNGDFKPSDITSGSDKKVWWKCKVCGHEWQAVIGSRNRGRGCPECAKEKRKQTVSRKWADNNK